MLTEDLRHLLQCVALIQEDSDDKAGNHPHQWRRRCRGKPGPNGPISLHQPQALSRRHRESNAAAIQGNTSAICGITITMNRPRPRLGDLFERIGIPQDLDIDRTVNQHQSHHRHQATGENEGGQRDGRTAKESTSASGDRRQGWLRWPTRPQPPGHPVQAELALPPQVRPSPGPLPVGGSLGSGENVIVEYE